MEGEFWTSQAARLRPKVLSLIVENELDHTRECDETNCRPAGTESRR
jgi:hypothetical protein